MHHYTKTQIFNKMVIGLTFILMLNSCLAASLPKPKWQEGLQKAETKACDYSQAMCQGAGADDEIAKRDCFVSRDFVLMTATVTDCSTPCGSSNPPDQRRCTMYCPDFQRAGVFCDSSTTVITKIYTSIRLVSSNLPSLPPVTLTLPSLPPVTLSQPAGSQTESTETNNQLVVFKTGFYVLGGLMAVFCIVYTIAFFCFRTGYRPLRN